MTVKTIFPAGLFLGGVDVNNKVFSFGFVFFALSILLFMRAARLRNEYYFGISSKGWSGMPTDKDLGEAFKRVKISMNEERDAELIELRHELKEIQAQWVRSEYFFQGRTYGTDRGYRLYCA